MALRHIGGLSLAAAVLVGCNNGYSVPDNSYPGGGGGNGTYGGGGVGTSGGDGDGGGSGSSGGYTSGGTSSGGSTGGTSSSGTGSGTSTSGGTSGGTSSGGTTGSGGSQLIGLLAFPVASAGQFLPIVSTDGGPAQMEFDLASYVLNCPGIAPQAGTTLVLILYSGDPNKPVTAGTYQFPPRAGGLPYASATIQQTDGFGGVVILATGDSGQVTWSYAFNGVATGSLSMNMSSNGGLSYLTGIFSAPFCGSF